MSKSDTQVLDFQKICRLCLVEKRSMSSIFSKKKSDKKVPLPIRIMTCASLELYEGDGLPASICSRCLTSVNQSFAFREQCEQADSTLRQYAQQMNNETSTTSVEDDGSSSAVAQAKTSVTGEASTTLYDCIEERLEETKEETQKSPEEWKSVNVKEELSNDVEVEYLEEEYLYSDDGDEDDGGCRMEIKEGGSDDGTVYDEGEVLEYDLIEARDLEADSSPGIVFIKMEDDDVYVKKEGEAEADDGAETVTCQLCEKEVRTDLIESHITLSHTYKTCEVCNMNVKLYAYGAHMKTHVGDMVKCNVCGKSYAKKDMEKHVVKHRKHAEDVREKKERISRKVCEICGFKVDGKGTLNRHMREKHDEGQNYCDLCEKYVRVKCYDKHVQDVHEDSENFCVICERSFKYYKVHMRSVHQDVIKFCSFCQVDVLALEYDEHVSQTHCRQSRFCETCNKEFFEYVCYRNHVNNIHLRVNTYKCSECNFTTCYRTSMDKHILGTHTKDKKFVCEHCNKTFMVKDNLRKHIRMIHKGQQKSMCAYCGKVCHANRELINHIRLHTGDLPYQCEFCSRKFPKKWTLDNHRRIHTGEKPYKCSHCDAAYGASAQMKIHEFREHGVEKYRHVDRAGLKRQAKRETSERS